MSAKKPKLMEGPMPEVDPSESVSFWIATERLDRGGRKVCGPFSTSNDANIARAYIEKLEGHANYWIASDPPAPRSE